MIDQPKPEKQDQEIVRVVLSKDGKINLTISSNHVPMLSYIHRLLGVEIDKKIIDERIQQQTNNGHIIVPKKHGIIDFMRGKHGG